MKPYHTRLTLIILTESMFTRAASQIYRSFTASFVKYAKFAASLSAKPSSVLPNGPPALLGYGSFVDINMIFRLSSNLDPLQFQPSYPEIG
jgi:hypothetical protein